MPATTEAKTTRPRARKAAAVPATPKTITKAEAIEVEASNGVTVDKLRVELESAGDTKRWAKFTAPDGSGCVGSLYVPLGAKSVKVLVEM